MLGNELNGLLVDRLPSSKNGLLPFKITETYLERGKNGRDLYSSFVAALPADRVSFRKVGQRYALVVERGFPERERLSMSRGANEVAIYPAFY